MRVGFVFAQPPENIFHVNDRIIHHFAERDDESAERDRVDRDTEFFQHDDGGEQRNGNRRQRNRRRARAAEQKEQHHRHQHATERERMFHVPQRRLDERRRPMQPGENRDALLLEHRFQFGQRSFERLRHFHRVRAVLAGHRHQHAGFSHDDCIAELRLCAFDHACHVLESYAETVRVRHDHFADLLRRE